MSLSVTSPNFSLNFFDCMCLDKVDNAQLHFQLYEQIVAGKSPLSSDELPLLHELIVLHNLLQISS